MSTKSTKRKATVKREAQHKAKGTTHVSAARAKLQKVNRSRGVRPPNDNPIMDAALSAVMVTKRMDPKNLPEDQGNAAARRLWCIANNSVYVIADEVCQKATTDRADNSVRSLITGHADPKVKKGIGVVIALDAHTRRANPKHPLARAVYLYRR